MSADVAFAQQYPCATVTDPSFRRTDVVRVADGVRAWQIDSTAEGLAFSANRTLLRGENDGTIAAWCLP